MYSGYGKAFDGKDEWSFDNGTAINVIIFGVDNSSSSHSDNRKNNFFNIRSKSNFYNYWELWFTREKV